MEDLNYFKVFVYLVSVTTFASTQQDIPITMNQLSEIVQNLEQNFRNFHWQHSRMDLLPNRDSDVYSEFVNPETLILELQGKIEKLIEDRKASLKKIVDSLEDSTKDYIWDDNLKINRTGLVFLRSDSESKHENISGEMSETLGVPVNKSLTGIHVPVEIYEGYPEVVNGLQWSSKVDEVFKKNLEENPTISWQYFGTKAGFMRLYPSVTSWYVPQSSMVDLFDVERRPWYIQASSSPKDVIILIDRSGSVHGQTFTIMKFAIQTLLDTLGEDDYVNVAAFNESTYWVSDIIHKEKSVDQTDCGNYSETLLQANNINKRALIADIQALTDVGMSNYSSAIEFAYEAFKKRANMRENGAKCHKMIMFFSDGGTDWPEAVFKRFENDTDTEGIRIFTYAIGAHPIPTAVLKQMSCDTGGKFTSIMTSSGVRTKIQDSYLGTISQALAESKEHPYHFTSAFTSAVDNFQGQTPYGTPYFDLARLVHYTDVLTDNYTLALAMPVFNQSNALWANESEWIGVAGIDIPIHHLENMPSRETLGPLGYPFIINQNGFVVIHPRLHQQHSYLDNPPNLDILDLELNSDKLEDVREGMINRKQKTQTIIGKVFFDMNHVLDKARIQYSFHPITGTSYSLGLVNIPDSRHLKIRNYFPPSPLDELRTVLAGWNFCGSQPSPPTPGYLEEKYGGNKHYKGCDPHLKDGLFWANNWTYTLQNNWKRNIYQNKDIINKAIYTRFGLAFITESMSEVEESDRANNLNSSDHLSDEVPTSSTYGREWRNPSENPALKRGILMDGLSFFPHQKGAFISKPASISSVVVAAVGINVTNSLLDEELKKAVTKVYKYNSSYVLFVDESATIIASSLHENSAGEFLGERWPELLKKLVSVNIYSSVKVSDFQAMCEGQLETRSEMSSAVRLDLVFLPLKFISVALLQIFSFFEYLQLLFVHTFFMSATSHVDAAPKTVSKQPCIIEHTIYHLTDSQNYEDSIMCQGTPSKILVQHFNSINALLIVVDKSLVELRCDAWLTPSTATSDFELFNPLQKRIVRPKQLACNQPRYRKGPTQCHMSLPQTCNGATKSLFPNALLIFVVILLGFQQ